MSCRFLSQRMISFIPARLAARIFSLIPPTGSTCPRKVISPLIAKYFLTFLCVNAEAKAVSIVIPALGPSFFIAPCGTCTWTFHFSKRSGVSPNFTECAFKYSSAMIALSFITSPKFPVRVNFPFPGVSDVSINKMSPPVGVQARPVTTPATSLF